MRIMSTTRFTFGYWLAAQRKAKKLTTDAASRRAKVHPSMWCDIEHDRRRPSHDTAVRMAKALKVNVSDFLARAGVLTPAARELIKKDARVVARLNAQAARRAVAA